MVDGMRVPLPRAACLVEQDAFVVRGLPDRARYAVNDAVEDVRKVSSAIALQAAR
jgi:hypothetical protein